MGLRAVVLAGRRNAGRLATVSAEAWEAMIPLADRPMLQWVVDALSGARVVDGIIVVGPADSAGKVTGKGLTLVEASDSMMDNIALGVDEAQRQAGDGPILLTAGDTPLVTAAGYDAFVDTCLAAGGEVFYPVVFRQHIEAAYPGTKRTYLKFREGKVTGGNIFVIHPHVVGPCRDLGARFAEARKSPARQAAIVGWGTLIGLLLGSLTLAELERRVCKLLGVTGKVIVTADADIGIDVDKPADYELADAVLKGRMQSRNR
ncbi:MAG: nucleotidyltransferase family protein [Bacillota bacterium]